MRVVVVEHLTSAPPPPGAAALVPEGRAMRDAVAVDLARLAGVRVAVLYRHGQEPPAGLPLQGIRVKGDRDAALRDALRDADAALVLAPEEGGCLARLASLVGRSGRILLGPSPEAIRLAGDKRRTIRLLDAAGIPTPLTRTFRLASAPGLADRRFPFIVKPRDGWGARGVSLVRDRDDIPAALAALRGAGARRSALIQERVLGEAASVSVIAGPGGPLALGLNRQRLSLRHGRFAYLGGETPWDHPDAAVALSLARAAVSALGRRVPGVAGYLGVDLVLTPAGPVVIEINPRLTTAYIGLRRALLVSPARLILQAALGRALPPEVAARGSWRYGEGGVVRPAAPRRRDGRRACLSA